MLRCDLPNLASVTAAKAELTKVKFHASKARSNMTAHPDAMDQKLLANETAPAANGAQH